MRHPDTRMKLSIIIPALNEAGTIAPCLRALQGLRSRGHELIVVDGGSGDGTPQLAGQLADTVIHSARGRGAQMNRGAAAAYGEVLVFLHADTLLPPDADSILAQHLPGGPAWGRFEVRLSGERFVFRIIEFLMNLRSRLTGIATGDQAMFVTRDLFRQSGGFADLELMEDIEFSARLKRRAPPLCLRDRVLTSSRRWEERGVMRTILGMWWLRLRYALGANPAHLSREYYGRVNPRR